MISSIFSVDIFNVKHKDGYYLISELKVGEEGNEYPVEGKTFASQLSAQNYLKSKGVDNNDAAACLLDALFDYQQKTSQAHIAQMKKVKAAKIKKELEK